MWSEWETKIQTIALNKVLYVKIDKWLNSNSSGWTLNWRQSVALFEKLKVIMMKTIDLTQPAFTCSKLTIETLEQGVKYVQS